MRGMKWWLVALAVCAVTSGGASTPAGAEDEARDDAAAVKALDVMRLRMEALLGEADVLVRLGRLDEALAVYREVGTAYERGLQSLGGFLSGVRGRRASVDHAGAAATQPAATRPAAGEIGDARGAVDAGLAWLAAHQAEDGHWDAALPPSGDAGVGVGSRVTGKPIFNVGVTGLATMAFLGAGHSPTGEGPYAATVARALQYLLATQDHEGCFGPRVTQQYIYGHLIASLVVCEAYGLSGDARLREPAQRGVAFTLLARNPYMGWRYGVKPGDNDTSVTSWAVLSLASARLTLGASEPIAGLAEAMQGALAWLEKVTDLQTGRIGYIARGSGPARPQEMLDRFPSDQSEAMTSAGTLARLLAGVPATDRTVQLSARLIQDKPPVWNEASGQIDMVHWYFGTLAAYQLGGAVWNTWQPALARAVFATQLRSGDDAGSWDPAGPWGPDGGRVYSTALMTLCAEVLMRYGQVPGTGGGR
ncbi:MAG: hypothetical protein AB7T63_04700 [Planctomycetota bacterium]